VPVIRSRAATRSLAGGVRVDRDKHCDGRGPWRLKSRWGGVRASRDVESATQRARAMARSSGNAGRDAVTDHRAMLNALHGCPAWLPLLSG